MVGKCNKCRCLPRVSEESPQWSPTGVQACYWERVITLLEQKREPSSSTLALVKVVFCLCVLNNLTSSPCLPSHLGGGRAMCRSREQA